MEKGGILMNVNELKKIIPWQELYCIEHSRELRKDFKNMAENIDHIPALYETDDNNDAKCLLHYFDTCGTADWYVFEVNMETGEAFGFVTYSGDINDPDAEFGYIDLKDLCKSARINLDLHFSGITKAQIKNIKYGKAVNEGENICSKARGKGGNFEHTGSTSSKDDCLP
jgi:hypothetical protein